MLCLKKPNYAYDAAGIVTDALVNSFGYSKLG